MTPTDKIKHLPDSGIADFKRLVLSDERFAPLTRIDGYTQPRIYKPELDGLIALVNEHARLVSELETKTRALEEISEVDSTEPKAIKYAKAIAQAALKGKE